jgi:hypothetical protein
MAPSAMQEKYDSESISPDCGAKVVKKSVTANPKPDFFRPFQLKRTEDLWVASPIRGF